MLTESETYIAIPPGYTIKEQLETHEITQKEFAQRMGLTDLEAEQLIEGEMILTPEIANCLAAVLGLSASFWNNLESYYQTRKRMAEAENAKTAK